MTSNTSKLANQMDSKNNDLTFHKKTQTILFPIISAMWKEREQVLASINIKPTC